MKVHVTAICGLLLLMVMPLQAQADDGDKAKTHSIRVQLLLVESSNDLAQKDRRALSGSSESVLNAIKELSSEGKATIINRVEMTVLEEMESMLQVGETVAIRAGTVHSGAGRQTTTYQDVSIGTLLKLRTKVVEGDVLIEMDFSKSFVPPPDEEDSEQPQGTSQLTHQTTLRIKDGGAQLAGGMSSLQSGDKSQAVQLIVIADVLDSSTSGQITKFQSFPRRSTRSPSASAPPSSRSSGFGFGPSRSRSSGYTPARPSSRSSARPSMRTMPDDARRRFAQMMFDRGDTDDDGKISKSELEALPIGGYKGDTPISKDKFAEWMSSNWPPSRNPDYSPSSRSRPSPFGSRDRSERSDAKKDAEEKNEAKVKGDAKDEGRKGKPDDKAKDKDAKDKDAKDKQDELGDTQIEYVPELDTIIIRGKKPDVQGVIGAIEKIKKADKEDKD